jgi:hypothetical protein
LKFIDGRYNRPSNEYFQERLHFEVKIKKITSFDLHTIIEPSLFGFELRVWGFVDVEVSFDLVLGYGLALDGLKLILLVVGFVIKVLIFTLTIFLFGFELFWNGIKTVLV